MTSQETVVLERESDLVLQPNERPKLSTWILLSIQHVFAMFGSTVIVPILTGLPVETALIASGIGTLIYTVSTKAKVPVYLGSSFAYIAAIQFFTKADTPNYGAAFTGLMSVGLAYLIIAGIIKLIGTDWLNRILPPIVVGPMIMVIGLGLAGVAIGQTGMTADSFNATSALIALITIGITSLLAVSSRGFFKIVPFLGGIIGGYLVSLLFQYGFGIDGIINIQGIIDAPWFSMPDLTLPFADYSLDFSGLLIFLPLTLVTVAEHIGDHTVLGNICNKNFIKNPGLHRTLIGDGLATFVSAFIGGPANTTYGENTGVVGMTKVASVYVTAGAAVIAILLAFVGKISAFINSIPAPVMGGISVILFGVIASNGVRVLINNRIDFGKQRNLIIAATMLIFGLGGATFAITEFAVLSGMSLAAIVGIVLNLVLPGNE